MLVRNTSGFKHICMLKYAVDKDFITVHFLSTSDHGRRAHIAIGIFNLEEPDLVSIE